MEEQEIDKLKQEITEQIVARYQCRPEDVDFSRTQFKLGENSLLTAIAITVMKIGGTVYWSKSGSDFHIENKKWDNAAENYMLKVKLKMAITASITKET